MTFSSLKPSTKPMKRGGFKPKSTADHARTRRQRGYLKSNSKNAKLARWSRMVRSRDWWTCQRCDGPGEHAHHRAPRSRRPDLKYSIDNGVTVCAPCHLWIHDHPREATETGWLSDVPYEVRGRVATEKLKEAA